MDASAQFSSRRIATAPLELTVGQHGSDFQTLQAAVDAVMWDFDLRGLPARIKVADGHYTDGVQVCGRPLGGTARPAIIIEGNLADPSRCWFDVNHGIAFENWGGHVAISGFKISARKGACISGQEAGMTLIGPVEFAETGGDHIHCSRGHVVRHKSDYVISGGAAIHAHVTACAHYANGRKVTLMNRPHFRHEFHGLNFSKSAWTGATFIGQATGIRYLVHYNSVCGIGRADPEAFFPGDRPGTVSDFSTMA